VREVWVAEPGNRGHARRRHSMAQAHLTGTGHFVRTDNDLVTPGTRANAPHEGIRAQ
jgi:hypothetical protein